MHSSPQSLAFSLVSVDHLIFDDKSDGMCRKPGVLRFCVDVCNFLFTPRELLWTGWSSMHGIDAPDRESIFHRKINSVLS